MLGIIDILAAIARQRLVVSVWIGIISALLSCGCQLQQEENDITLIFKHTRLLGRREGLRPLLDDFEKKNPRVKVVEEELPTSSDQQHLFYVTNLEAGSSDFDLFALDVIWVPEFSRAGWLLDLSSYLGAEGAVDFLSGPLHAATYSGRLYAVPWFVDGGVLYFRQDLLGKYGFAPPETFAELVHSAQVILQQEQNPRLTGFLWQGKQYEGLVCVALEFIRAHGGDVLNSEGRPILTSPQSGDAVRYMRDLISRYQVSPPLVTTADEEITRQIFGQGEAIYMRNWPYAWHLFAEEGSPVQGKVGVASLPHVPGQKSMPTLGGWHLGINRYSRHPDLAFQLLRRLTSFAAQKELAVEGGLKPSLLPVYEDEEVKRAQPSLGHFFPVLQSATPRPVTPFYLMLSQVLQGELSAAVTGIKEPEQALRDAEQQIVQILAMEEE
jgi:multiple sugar transport system substrate-binding protein